VPPIPEKAVERSVKSAMLKKAEIIGLGTPLNSYTCHVETRGSFFLARDQLDITLNACFYLRKEEVGQENGEMEDENKGVSIRSYHKSHLCYPHMNKYRHPYTPKPVIIS
jgi:hypothetical protein